MLAWLDGGLWLQLARHANAAAAELAADVRRYLANLPISARPATTVYQLRKFARRNTALVGGVSVYCPEAPSHWVTPVCLPESPRTSAMR